MLLLVAMIGAIVLAKGNCDSWMRCIGHRHD